MSNKHLKNIQTLKEAGFTLKTLLSLSKSQISSLSKKLHETEMSDLTREKANALEDKETANADLAKINADIETASEQERQTNETEEVEDVDNMGNPEWEQTDNGNVKQGLLDGEELEMDEMTMYDGAPETQTSFRNPDASGFQSQGPMDSYGQFDGEGDVGLDEISTPNDSSKYDLFKKYEQNLYGLEDDMKEDTEQIDVGDASKGEYTQTPAQQQAPDGMGDGGDPGSRGMGNESVQTLTKKTIMEVAASKAQKRMFCFALDCKKSKYEDCGTGTDVKNVAKSNTLKELKEICNTSDEGLPEKVKNEQRELDNLIMNIVERYEKHTFSKEELIDTVKEAFQSSESPTIAPSRPTTTPITRPKKPGIKTPYKPKHKPKPKAQDTEKSDLPSWLEFDNIFTPEVDKIENKQVYEK